MSGAPNLERQASDSLSIPERRVVIKDPNEIPLDYSTTPGGTMFSTTPGGKFDNLLLFGFIKMLCLASLK